MALSVAKAVLGVEKRVGRDRRRDRPLAMVIAANDNNGIEVFSNLEQAVAQRLKSRRVKKNQMRRVK